jgi:glucosamine-6-phosphate deaminase
VTDDYVNNGLEDLVKTFGSANVVNVRVFRDVQRTITGWPGGKPGADDSERPVKALPNPKRIVVFSPHPDDDVLFMGGTLSRLVEAGHDVHVAYQTPGSLAVRDDYLYQMLDLTQSFSDPEGAGFAAVKETLAHRHTGEDDSPEIRKLKAIIRHAEARAAGRYIGITAERQHFLNLPFYDTGRARKKPLSGDDVNVIVNLLREVKPHQIYAAGDLQDPHGTHYLCLCAVLRAIDVVKEDDWFNETVIWWYKGGWTDWSLDKVDMAVPISPAEMMTKRLAIFKHSSQANDPPFPGDDAREFWVRSEERNRRSADLYRQLGMAEYEAMEWFTRYNHITSDWYR